MNLEKFLTNFLKKLKDIKIPYCILRNYEGLPRNNFSNDIDILIRPGDKFVAIKELLNFDDIKITECCERSYVTSLFIFGVNWGKNYHAIQLDLVTALNWKGLPYLNVEQVIKESRPSDNSIDIIMTPYPPHEAIISFFSSYLIGGWIKTKYQPKVRKIFARHREEIITFLSQIAKFNIVERVVDSVCSDRYDKILEILPRLRGSIFLHYISSEPLYSLKLIFHHCVKEMLIRYTPMYINEVCVFGPDGSGKSSAINIAKRRLMYTTKVIQIYHLKPQIFSIANTKKPVVNPHGAEPRSPLISVLKLLVWSLEYWIKKVFHGFKNPTLILWDRYFHDLLIDPYRYRFGAPLIFARIFSKLVPKPGLMIFLDASPKLIQMRKKEVSPKETARQQKGYLKLAEKLKNSVVIDASSPIELVVERLNNEIIGFLANKKKKQIGYIINKKSYKRNFSARI
jgi:thymidylate kinase